MATDSPRNANQVALINAATRLGYGIDDHLEQWGIDAVHYLNGPRKTLVIDGQIFANLTHSMYRLLADKQVTKAIVGQLDASFNIRTPASLRWPECGEHAIATLLQRGPVVCKPVDGSEGAGVAMHLTSTADIVAHANTLGSALIEAQIAGHDLRIQVIAGNIVAACTRRPAAVFGDGVHTLEQLIEARREQMATQNPANALEIDAVTSELLARQQLSLGDTPAPGQRVQLKHTANMATGATAVDVTDQVHPAYQQWVTAIAKHLNLQIFALDILTTDHTRQPAQAGAHLLEINSHPQWVHHTFSEGRTHDIGAMLLGALLGEPTTG